MAPLLPSGLGGAKAIPGDGGLTEAEAMDRGTRLHLLLEHLPLIPPAGWAAAAAELLGPPADLLAEAALADLLEEATGVLTSPALAALRSLPNVQVTTAGRPEGHDLVVVSGNATENGDLNQYIRR